MPELRLAGEMTDGLGIKWCNRQTDALYSAQAVRRSHYRQPEVGNVRNDIQFNLNATEHPYEIRQRLLPDAEAAHKPNHFRGASWIFESVQAY
jgi:hypothetical protein